ncbi:MAG: hypothetical protein HY548_04300, partial [Elusimicrobia bacterium]|nr:hypothetical protein [Elusimicrobiota bacterium]
LLFAGREMKWNDLTAQEKDDLLKGKTVKKATADGEISLSLAPGQSTVIVVNMDVTTKTVRNNAQFDAKGRLSGFKETVTSTGGNLNKTEVRERKDITYNAKGQIASYTDVLTSTDAPAVTTTIERSGMLYDPLGQLTGYEEKTIQREANVVLKSLAMKRSGILFDAIGRLLGYDEDVSGTGIVGTRRLQRRKMTYSGLGQLIGYREKTVDSDGYTVDNEVSGIVYNSLNQETGRKEKITTTAYEANGTEIYRLAVEKTRDHVSYNDLGQMTYYRDTEVSSDTPDITKKTVWSRGEYNPQGQLKSYREKVTTRGTSGGQSIDLTVTTDRTSTTYNSRGQALFTEDVVRRSDSPDLVTTQTQDAMAYDDQGFLLTFIQTSLEQKGGPLGLTDLKKKVTKRLSTIYNDSSLVSGYKEEIQTTGTNGTQALDVTETVESTNRLYSRARILVGYTDTRTPAHAPAAASTTQWSALLVDGVGRVKKFQEVEKTDGKTVTTVRDAIGHDAFGRTISYQEASTDSSRPDLKSTTAWKGTYNPSNQLTSFEETRRDFHAADSTKYDLTTTRKRFNIEHDGLNQMTGYDEVATDGLGSTTTQDWSGTYDNLGQMTGFTEKSTQEADGLDLKRETARTAMLYDNRGRLLSYQEDETSSDSENMLNRTLWTAKAFDPSGRASAFDQEERKFKKGLLGDTLLETVKKSRTGISYNALGQLIGYAENQTDHSDTPDLRIETVFAGAVYNGFGLLASSKETVKERSFTDNGATLAKVEEKTESRTFDNRGRLASGQTHRETYEDKPNAARLVTDRTLTVTDFNAYGRIRAYKEKVDKKGAVLDQTITTTRTGILYDTRGRQTGYTDDINSSESPDVTNRVENTLQYDDNGEKLGRVSLSREDSRRTAQANGTLILDARVVTTRQGFIYKAGSFGQTEKYTEIVDDKTLGFATTTERTAIDYDLLGQVTGYSEKATRSDSANALDSSQSIQRQGQKYDRQGRLIEYEQ